MERAYGKDAIQVGALIPLSEKLRWKAKWKIQKFKGDFKTLEEALKAKAELLETLEFEGNLLLNEGIDEMWDLITGAGGTAYNNTNARIGVGNSNTAAQATDTGLLGGSTAFKAMDGGYPTSTTQKATFRSTFGSADANFAWEEITVDNGSAPDKNLNRKVQAMGTKAGGTTWVATLEITLS